MNFWDETNSILEFDFPLDFKRNLFHSLCGCRVYVHLIWCSRRDASIPITRKLLLALLYMRYVLCAHHKSSEWINERQNIGKKKVFFPFLQIRRIVGRLLLSFVTIAHRTSDFVFICDAKWRRWRRHRLNKILINKWKWFALTIKLFVVCSTIAQRLCVATQLLMNWGSNWTIRCMPRLV